jgi:hypothetical protein
MASTAPAIGSNRHGPDRAQSSPGTDVTPSGARRLLRQAPGAAELLAVLAVSVAFGVSFGFNYGVNNQVVYLLGSLQVLEPGLLENDWLASHTTHYHPAFKYLGALLIGLNREGWGVGIGLTFVVAAGCVCLYWLIRNLLADRRQALAAFALLMSIAFITNVRGPGLSYVFDGILQPSTIGTLGLLAAAVFFAQGRWLPSGVCTAFGGLFHANYCVLLIMSLTTAHVLLGRRELFRRLLLQLGPPMLVMLTFLPMILGTAASRHAAEAQQIYFNIRAPHHYVLSSFEHDFVPVIAWQLVGIGVALPAMKRGFVPMQRFGAMLGGLSAIVWGGVALSAAGVAQATHLFPWRIAPHLMLLLQAVTCVSVIRLMCDPSLGRRYSGAEMALLAAGLGALFLHHGIRKQPALPMLLLIVLLAVGTSQIIGWSADAWVSWSRKDPPQALNLTRATWSRAGAWIVMLGASVLFYNAAEVPVRTFDDRSTLIRGIDRYELDLYRWMKSSTQQDAVFLTPPNIETMRYHGQRPIVVDWKGNPVVPEEILEWAQRLQDVTGSRRLGGPRDLSGYDRIDVKRLELLRTKYRIDYAVVRRGIERRLTAFPVAYANRAFTVLDVRGSNTVAQPRAEGVHHQSRQ